MATVTMPPSQLARQPKIQADPQPRRWTKVEYYQIADLGLFEDQYVQLIDGEIMILAHPGNPHCVSMESTAEAFRGIFGPGHWVRTQMALNLSLASEPAPDVAVVIGRPRDFTEHPTTALVVIEISDSTLAFDRGPKASLYARAGIADYWIVNLVDRRLEVHRNPIADAAQPFGFRYADITVLQPGQSVTPVAAPQANVAVADLLP